MLYSNHELQYEFDILRLSIISSRFSYFKIKYIINRTIVVLQDLTIVFFVPQNSSKLHD